MEGPQGRGWRGLDPNSKSVKALQQQLAAEVGLPAFEVHRPEDTQAIATSFHRDGFAVVKDVLSESQVNALHRGCLRVIDEILTLDPEGRGNRGSHRYSFGSASLTDAQLHQPEWVALLEIPSIIAMIETVFGGPDFLVRSAGGDFCLPGACDYQPLHSDMSDRQSFELKPGKSLVVGSFFDREARLNYRDLPCPYIACNFITSDWTSQNGPIRHVAGTQNSQVPMPSLAEEPTWMRSSRLYPLSAGSVILRDVRAWHGGTPNVSDEVRAMPNVEFFAPWYREPLVRSLPLALYRGLGPEAQRRCRYIVERKGTPLKLGYRRHLGGTPENSRSRVTNASID
jgi:ectoine hydroxylase-related dioxygenase (phytanoyl-CoA dioxygenase family)